MYYLFLNRFHDLVLYNKNQLIDSINLKNQLKYTTKILNCSFYRLNCNLLILRLITTDSSYNVFVHIQNNKIVMFQIKEFCDITYYSQNKIFCLENSFKYTTYDVIRHSLFRYEFLKSLIDDVSQVNSVSYDFRNGIVLKVYERTHQVGQIRTFVLIDNTCNIYTFHVPINTHVIRRFYKNNLLFCYFCEDTIEILKFKTAQIYFKTSLQTTTNNIQVKSIDLNSVYYSCGKRLYQYEYSKSTKIANLETIKHRYIKPHRKSEIIPMNLSVIDVYIKILNTKFNKDISNHILQFLL